MDANYLVGLIAVVSLFIVLPWVLLHHITKWKTAATLTGDDEALLEELYQLARRLADRVDTVERLVASDHPDFRPGASLDGLPYERAMPTMPEHTARPLTQPYRQTPGDRA